MRVFNRDRVRKYLSKKDPDLESFVASFKDDSLYITLNYGNVTDLSEEELRNSKYENGGYNPTMIYEKSHDSGWIIRGKIKEDWFFWVNEFTAQHSEYGEIYGDFMEIVNAKNAKSMYHFLDHHPPDYWDSREI